MLKSLLMATASVPRSSPKPRVLDRARYPTPQDRIPSLHCGVAAVDAAGESSRRRTSVLRRRRAAAWRHRTPNTTTTPVLKVRLASVMSLKALPIAPRGRVRRRADRRLGRGSRNDLSRRELIGRHLLAVRRPRRGGARAFDTCTYYCPEIERPAFSAGRVAPLQTYLVVDKANVLKPRVRRERSVVARVSRGGGGLAAFVDNAAMQTVRQPALFDVIVTENNLATSSPTRPASSAVRWACSPRRAWGP